jgi:F-type H+-transporting ATPase subunit alpha
MLAPPSTDLRSHVFAPKVAQSRRAPISQPLHTGVLAIDSLAPIGRGQSMLILGPDTLPPGAGRSALAHRVLSGAAASAPDVKRVYVTDAARGGDASRAAWAEGTRVLTTRTDAEMLIAAQAGCSLAQAGGGDALVVVDDLEPLRRLWKASCDAATVRHKPSLEDDVPTPPARRAGRPARLFALFGGA